MNDSEDISVFRKETPNTINKVLQSVIKNSAYYYEISELNTETLYEEFLKRKWSKQDIEDWLNIYKQEVKDYKIDTKWHSTARKILSNKYSLGEKFIDYKIPFIAVLWPISELAVQKIQEKIKLKQNWQLKETALTGIRYSFCKKIEPIFNKVIATEFYLYINKGCSLKEISTRKKIEHQEKYKEYVSVFLEDISKIYYHYPVLLKQLSIQMYWYVSAVLSFLERLEKDTQKIKHHFGIDSSINSIVEIEAELSDAHNKGKTVIKVSFSNGDILIYKPRSLKNEESYSSFTRWLNLEYNMGFRPLNVLNCENYGWIEFIEWKPCSSQKKIKEFYSSMGKQLCLFYLLQGTDFHYENLIAHEEYPVFIDMETVFTIINVYGRKGFNRLYMDLFLTDFLHRVRYLYTNTHDISALNMNPSLQIDEKKMPDYFQTLSDLEKGRVYQKMMNAYHLPFEISKKDQIFQKYNKEIMNGFCEIYQIFLIFNKEQRLEKIMSFFSGVIPRIIIRSTRQYCDFRDSGYLPVLLRSGKDFSLYYEGLCVLDSSKRLPREVVREEINAIIHFDIPYFTNNINRRWLKHNGKVIVKNYNPESTYNLFRKKINGLSQNKLYEQINLYYSYTAILKTPKALPKFQKMKKEAGAKLDKIINQKNKIKQFTEIFYSQSIYKYLIKKSPVTFFTAHDLMMNQKKILPVNTHLIGGTPFIGLLMLVLYKKTNKKLYLNWIENVYQVFKPMAIEPINHYDNTQGLFGGIGFATVFTSLYSHITKIPSSQYIATSIARKAIFIKSKQKSSHTIINGMAGFILSCLICKMCTGQNFLDRMIFDFSNKLLESIKRSKEKNQNSLSMLFGDVGVSFVLFLVSAVLKKTEFWEAGQLLIKESYSKDSFKFNETDETQFRYIMLEAFIFILISEDIIPGIKNYFIQYFDECQKNDLLTSSQIGYLESFNSTTNISNIMKAFICKKLSTDPTSSKYYLNAKNLFEITLINFCWAFIEK